MMNVYRTPAWMQLLSNVHGHFNQSLTSKNAYFPLALIKSRIFGNRLISVPFGDCGGISGGNTTIQESLIKKSVEKTKELNADFLEIRDPPQAELFSQAGFIRRNDYTTFELDLTIGSKQLWNNLEKRTRNGVVHGQKEKLKIYKAKTKKEVHSFFHLYTLTMKQLGSPPQPIKWFDAMWDAFYKSRQISIFLTEKNNMPAAGMLCFENDKKVHYAYSCSNAGMRSLRASDALLWHAISHYAENRFSEFDFGRTRPNSGVHGYKKGWGGKERTTPYFYHFNKKQAHGRLENKYLGLSKMWRDFLPKTVADQLGPKIIRQIG